MNDIAAMQPLASLDIPRLGPSADKKAQAVAAGKDFESMFLSQMMAPMMDGLDEGDDVTGAGEGSDIYRSLMVNEYGKLFSARGGIGIAESVTRQLLKQQEAS